MSRADIIRMAISAKLPRFMRDTSDCCDALERFASLVAAAKQEECANACEGDFDSEMKSYGRYFSAAIRALK